MKRIFLFIVTNLAVLALLSVVMFVIERVFGVRLPQGSLGGLLVFAAVFGFGGALISLALSKWTAKRMMGVRVIGTPQSEVESWLMATVTRLAAQARIGMPEVGHLRGRGNERLRDRRAAQCGAGGGEHRPAARHVAGTGRSGNGPRNHSCGERRHGYACALLQGVLNTFVIFLARIIGGLVDRALVQERPAGIRHRLLFDHHGRANRARHLRRA